MQSRSTPVVSAPLSGLRSSALVWGRLVPIIQPRGGMTQSSGPTKNRSGFRSGALLIDCEEFSFNGQTVRQQLACLEGLIEKIEERVHRSDRSSHRLIRMQSNLRSSLLFFESEGKRGSSHFLSFMEMRLHIKALQDARTALPDWERYQKECLSAQYYDHFFLMLSVHRVFELWGGHPRILPESDTPTPDLVIRMADEEFFVEVKTKRKLIDPSSELSAEQADQIVKKAFERAGSSRQGQLRGRRSVIAICGYFSTGKTFAVLERAASSYFARLKRRSQVGGILLVNVSLRLKQPNRHVIDAQNLIVSIDTNFIANEHQEVNLHFARLESEPMIEVPPGFKRWASDELVRSSPDWLVATQCPVALRVGPVLKLVRAVHHAVSTGRPEEEIRALLGALRNAGNQELQCGDLREARRAHAYLLSFHRSARDLLEESYDLINLGIVSRREGRLEEATSLLRKAWRIGVIAKDDKGKVLALNGLGSVWWDLGKPLKALMAYLGARKLNEKLGNIQGMAMNFGNIGLAYLSLNKASQAASAFEHAYALCERIHDREGEGANLSRLASLALRGGDPVNARKLASAAQTIFAELKANRLLAEIYHLHGYISIAEGSHERAKLEFWSAIRLLATTLPHLSVEQVAELLTRRERSELERRGVPVRGGRPAR